MHAVTRIKSHEQATRDARSYGNKAVVDIRLPQSVAAHGGSVWVYISMSDRAPVESLWVYALLASLIPGHYLLTWRHPRPWVTSTKLVKTVGVVLGIFSQNVRLYQLSRCRPASAVVIDHRLASGYNRADSRAITNLSAVITRWRDADTARQVVEHNKQTSTEPPVFLLRKHDTIRDAI